MIRQLRWLRALRQRHKRLLQYVFGFRMG